MKEHVKKHLEKRHIPESKLTEDAKKALDDFSEAELNKVDTLGETLMNDGMLDDKQKISAVH
jgi:hypothetical protein